MNVFAINVQHEGKEVRYGPETESGLATIRHAYLPRMKPEADIGSTRLQTFHDTGDCCSRLLRELLFEGKLTEMEEWQCPRCLTPWRPRMVGDITHWEPHDEIILILPKS